ncbi:hypothetical protein ACKWOV_23140, partial [Escherichia coli]|uniref:hypothetical protein n=2 Tax=Enterobacteriaceae TaxID=543 RepID=UPI0039049A8E
WLYRIYKTGIANRLGTECGNHHHYHDFAAFFFYLKCCRNLASSRSPFTTTIVQQTPEMHNSTVHLCKKP